MFAFIHTLITYMYMHGTCMRTNSHQWLKTNERDCPYLTCAQCVDVTRFDVVQMGHVDCCIFFSVFLFCSFLSLHRCHRFVFLYRCVHGLFVLHVRNKTCIAGLKRETKKSNREDVGHLWNFICFHVFAFLYCMPAYVAHCRIFADVIMCIFCMCIAKTKKIFKDVCNINHGIFNDKKCSIKRAKSFMREKNIKSQWILWFTQVTFMQLQWIYGLKSHKTNL